MQGIADGAAGKLVGDQIIVAQFLIQRLGDVILNHQGVPQAQTVTLDEGIVHFGFDIHQRLIDTDDIGGADFIFRLSLLQERIAGVHRKIVFGLTFTRKFHLFGGSGS
ncbi:hypothetical protein D3C72_2079750 [compost metagenome]